MINIQNKQLRAGKTVDEKLQPDSWVTQKYIVLQTFDSITETLNRGPHFGIIRQMGQTYLHEKEQ